MEKPIAAIQQLIKTAIQEEWSPLADIKKVYFGDPVLIPESSMPAITIAPKTEWYIRRWSRYDQKSYTIEIRLVYNQKLFYGKWDNAEKVFIVDDCMKKVWQVNNDLQSVSWNTICWIIQKNYNLPFTEEDESISYTATDAHVNTVNYQLTQLRWYPTYEAIVQVQATLIGDR